MASVRPCKFKYFGGLLHAQRDRIGRRRRGSHYTLGLGHSEAGNDALEDGHGHGTDARDDAVQVGEGGGELSSGQWCGVSIERLGCSSDHLSCFQIFWEQPRASAAVVSEPGVSSVCQKQGGEIFKYYGRILWGRNRLMLACFSLRLSFVLCGRDVIFRVRQESVIVRSHKGSGSVCRRLKLRDIS